MRLPVSEPASPVVPLLPATVALLAGYALGLAVSGIVLGLVLVGVGGALAPRVRRIALAFAFGSLAAFGTSRTEGLSPGEVPLERAGWYAVEGVVAQVEPAGHRGKAMVVDVDAVGEGRERRPVRFRVRAALPSHALVPLLAPGTRVTAVVFLDPDRRGRRVLYGALGPGLRVTARAGVLARAAHALRMRAVRVFDESLARDDAALARALIAGDRSALRRQDRSRFRDAGQAHMLAVSGLHVGLLLAGVVMALRFFGVGWRTTWAAALGIVLVYVPFAGAPASAVRAGVGIVLFLVSRLLGRAPTGIGVLTAVVALVFVFDSRAFTGVGLQLSLFAVLGILLLSPPIARAFVPQHLRLPGLPPPPRAWVRRSLAVALGAWLGTAPLVMAVTGKVCAAGAPVSVLALPFVTVLVALGFLLLILGGAPWITEPVSAAFAFVADLLRGFFDLVLDLGLGRAAVAAPGPVFVAVWIGLALVILRGSRRAVFLALAAMFAVVLVSALTGDDHASARADASEGAAVTDPWALLALTLGLAVLAAVSVRLAWLTKAGAAGAFVLGFAAGWQAGWVGLAALVFTFLVTTLLSKLPGRHRTGARSLRQVVANGLAPMVGLALCALDQQMLGETVFLAGLAFLGADTVGAEIGVRYGGPARRLPSFRPCARGVSGGVTWLGTLASALGACLPMVPITAAALLSEARADYSVLGAIVPAAGFAGALLDSALGDLLQYRGRIRGTSEITELTSIGGAPTERVSGWRWLDNDGVNLASGLATAALAAILFLL